MKPGFSLYLDAVRFAAALAVVLSHLAYERFSGGGLQILRDLDIGRDAVVLFFVLSGLVIAYAAERGADGRRFTFNRATRLYSVLVPALILTLLFDGIGRLLDPAMYQGWWYAGLPVSEFLLRGLSFSNEWFGDPVRLGTNGPLWSLSYEACYYAMFGIAFYLSGGRRILLLALVAFMAGPRILVLMPAWLFGVVVWQALKRQSGGGPGASVAGRTIMIAGFPAVYGLGLTTDLVGNLDILSNALAGFFQPGFPLGFSANFLWYWVLGAAFAVHLAGMHRLAAGGEISRFSKAVRWLAGGSFTLYVLHYPALQMLHTVLPAELPYRGWALLAVTLLICFAVAEVCERRIGPFRNWCARSTERLRAFSVSRWHARLRRSLP